MRIIGEGEAADKLRKILREMEQKSAKDREREDRDFKRVSERLQWLLENQYQVTPQFLAHDTGVPLERLEAIEDRLSDLARECVGDGGHYCP